MGANYFCPVKNHTLKLMPLLLQGLGKLSAISHPLSVKDIQSCQLSYL